VEVIEKTGRPRKTIPADRRKLCVLKVFNPIKSKVGARKRSKNILNRAKTAALNIIEKQEKLSKKMYPKVTPFEQAFMDASGSPSLDFSYSWMKHLIARARYTRKSWGSSGDTPPDKEGRAVSGIERGIAFNNCIEIRVNPGAVFTVDELTQVLVHESLHNTVERAKCRGNPALSADIEHRAMALLGDRDEQ